MIVVLHLGAHKTGTSLIQKYMRDRPKIMRRNRIAMLSRSSGDKLIGWGQDKILSPGLPVLQKNIRRAALLLRTRYVLSHENALGRPFAQSGKELYPDASARARQIADGLPGKRKIAVYYIRDQVSFLESYYLQTIQQGKHHLFDEWVNPKLDGSLSWRPLYEGLCAALGKENVLLKDFGSQIRQGQARFLCDFFSAFMPVDTQKFGEFEYPARRNLSIGDVGLELALKINPYLKSWEAQRSTRNFLQQIFSNADFPRPVLLSDDQKQMLTSKYEAENQDLIQESERTFIAPHRAG
ncbi:MAG: hypothetical protein WBB85_14870 [Albidovulum sp.]|uniref:hypothetical protein n=1 Tax=Albidovulum sp. TaxID=1872424 RepID=UPI003C97B636